jgi:hypothetical protein
MVFLLYLLRQNRPDLLRLDFYLPIHLILHRLLLDHLQ